MNVIKDSPSKTSKYMPLSYSQRNIWNLETAYPRIPLNNICSTLKISGRFDVALLQKSVCAMIKSAAGIRTRICLVDGEPMQYIDDYVPDQVPYFDFTMTRKEGVYQWDVMIAREIMPLYDSPLYYCAIFKLSDGTGGILVKTHHIISDAWTQVLLNNLISNNYLALLAGKELSDTDMPSYMEHIRLENEYFSSPAYKKDIAYWENCMAELPATNLKEHQYAILSPVGCRRSHLLPDRLNRLMGNFCRKEKVSPFAVFYMALAIYLKRIKGQNRFCIGVPVANRSTFSEKQTSGMFVNTLPFVNELDDSISFSEFNQKLMLDWFRLLRHQRLPFPKIKELAKGDAATSGRLFDIVFSFQNGHMVQTRDAHLTFEGRWHYSGYQAEALCIHLSNREQENTFLVDYDYLTQVFSPQEIDTIHQYLVNILQDALEHPEKPICELSILGADEEERLLFAFNRTKTFFPTTGSLSGDFTQVASIYARRAALIHNGQRMTYQELYHRSLKAASGIQSFCQKGNQVVAILLPRSFDLFTAVCGTFLSGNAWLLLDAAMPIPRLVDLISRSGAALLIAPENISESLRSCVRTIAPQELLAFDEMTDLPISKGEDLAYLVYTSGSTGLPKAVEIEQHSIVNFACAMQKLYAKGAVLSACNVSFDAFLLESICPLLNGCTIVLANDEEGTFPSALAKLITGYDVGFIAMTPSRLAAYIREPQFAHALRGVERIVLGGEVLTGELYQALRLLSNARVFNQYGPSEATVGVTYDCLNEFEDITIGRPMPNCCVYVLDRRLQPMPVGATGEIYIGGVCLARGYRNDPELTQERFIQSPFNTDERLYKTGDLGMWNKDGRLSFLGRADQQLKIRGLRIEPAEIEARLMMHPAVDAAVVRAFQNEDGSAFLAAYFTANASITGDELITFASAYLPRHMVPVYAERLNALPTTKNGKIDYERLPRPTLRTSDGPAMDDIEEALLAIWRQILARPNLGVSHDYFISGGNSLNAVELLTAVEKHFGRTFTLNELYTHSTVRRFAELIRGGRLAASSRTVSIERAGQMENYPLSPAQKSFYVLHQMDHSGIAYNIPGIFHAAPKLDPQRLEQALCKLVAMDDGLRTRFEMTGDDVRQSICPQVDFHLKKLTCSTLAEAQRAFVRPFDLRNPPLLRAALWESASDEQYFLIDMPHIVSDGLSGKLLIDRLNLLYRGEEVQMPALRYVDYAVWMEKNRQSIEAPQRAYWTERFKDGVTELDLPCDYPRPAVFDGKGGKFKFAMKPELYAACRQYADAHHLTPFVLFVAALGLLLSRLSGQSQILIGTPVSGRRHEDVKNINGVFVNTLPLSIQVSGELPVSQYLERIREDALSMLDNQELPFDEIVSLLNVPRSMNRNPLYNVLFSLSPSSTEGICLGESHFTAIDLDTNSCKMDLTLEAMPCQSGYDFTFEYATSLFRRDTIALFSRSYLTILEGLVLGGDVCLNSISSVSTFDRIRLYDRPMRMRTPYEASLIDHMIDRMAEICPDAVAVEWGDGFSYTFAEFKKRTDSLASFLLEKGAQPGDRIGLLCKRTGDMLAALVGILKAGCAYMPMDSAFPDDRMLYMLENTNVALLVAGEGVHPPVNCPCPVIPMDFSDRAFTPVQGRSIEDPFFVLYTSGSTGKPKGVVVKHKGVASLLCDVATLLDAPDASFLCVANVIFDVFTTESLMALALGKRVVMADEEEMLLPWKMAKRLRTSGANVLQLTPSRMQMCLSDPDFVQAISAVRLFMLPGESFNMSLVEALRKSSAGRIINIYGPTESTIFSSWADLTESDSVHIGHPTANTRFYALNEDGLPVMPGACAELYIAGEGVAAGYMNRPDLTQQAFLPDTFFPGEKMYRTGDYVRLRADGFWDFRGRRDRQIKLNGHRIEIDEVVGQIIKSGLAKEAAVLPVLEGNVPKSLTAYIVPSEEYTEAALIRFLTPVLPEYMIPSRMITLNDLPRTASGKTDMLALGRIQTSQSPATRPASTADSVRRHDRSTIESEIAAIWEEVLQHAIDYENSFFQQGGTSLMALSVLSKYYQKNLQMSLSDFYQNPTVVRQAELLRTPGDAPVVSAASENETKGTSSISTFPVNASQEKGEGDILLTGATGYLGAHLLDALLQRGERCVICLIRGGSRERLNTKLAHYFGSGYPMMNQHRIEVIDGDILAENLGLTPEACAQLGHRLRTIYHAAADVRHYAPEEELMRTNLEGTKRICAFAQAYNISLRHISTTSICGTYLSSDPDMPYYFSERQLNVGQNFSGNLYVKSKLLAEEAIARAMQEGLHAHIFRVGRLTARAADGMFQENYSENAFYRTIRGALELGVVPAEFASLPVEVTPVDLCARAIVALEKSSATVFHIFNPNYVEIGKLLEGRVSKETNLEFERRLREALSQEHSPYLDAFAEFYNSTKQRRATIQPVAQETMCALAQLGFIWPAVDIPTQMRCYSDIN